MISIIVPVYNRENKIGQCINSILDADYKDIELILVDDGSTDKTLEVCYSYAQKDSRVIVLHQQNAGVSEARNNGLSHAKGEWITFVDSDDAVRHDHFGIIKELNTDYDLVQVKQIYVKQDAITAYDVTCNEHKNDVFCNTHVETIDFLFGRFDPYRNSYFMCHDKFFKKQIIENNQIRFDKDCTLGEDQIFVCQYLQYTNKYTYQDVPSSLRINWQDSNTFSLSGRSRPYQEYIEIIRKNFDAMMNLYIVSSNESLKRYAYNYRLSRPIQFIVLRNHGTWRIFRSKWEYMNKGLSEAQKSLDLKIVEYRCIKNTQIRFLYIVLCLIGKRACLYMSWCLHLSNYLREGIKYRLNKSVSV